MTTQHGSYTGLFSLFSASSSSFPTFCLAGSHFTISAKWVKLVSVVKKFMFTNTKSTIDFQCVFLIWCMLPVSWNGSNIIYLRFIRPFILRHEGEIDKTIREVKEGTKNLVDSSLANGESFIFSKNKFYLCLHKAAI